MVLRSYPLTEDELARLTEVVHLDGSVGCNSGAGLPSWAAREIRERGARHRLNRAEAHQRIHDQCGAGTVEGSTAGFGVVEPSTFRPGGHTRDLIAPHALFG